MKRLFAGLFAALLALSAVAAHAAPLNPTLIAAGDYPSDGRTDGDQNPNPLGD